jgi:transposase-like protein
VTRRHKDAPPFLGRLYGDALLQAYADCASIADLCLQAGVKRWELHRWVREARNGRPE